MKTIATALVVLLALGIAPAVAQNKTEDSAKKTSDGVGGLLQGMGQEINKLGGTLTSDSKKDGKKAKPAAKAQEKKN